MSDVLKIGRNASGIEKQDAFDGYSRVVLTVSDGVEYAAGSDTGRTMTLCCPWGSQKMANDILDRLRGFQYQPYAAADAHIDPAAELGDGVSVGSVYSGIFEKDISHGPLYTADIAAPGGGKINYEYPYKSPETRKVERQYKELRASLNIQAGEISAEVLARKESENEIRASIAVQEGAISAKVSKTGGSSASFAWNMVEDHASYIASGKEVFRVDKNGAEVNGIIRATGGKIGGFDIQSNYLSYNDQTWGGTNTIGAYLGINGIQLGKKFRVDMQGNMYAESGTFSGTVKAGRIEYGGDSGYFNGSGISAGSITGGYGGKIGYGSLSTYNMVGGINTSLGYADFSNGVFNGYNTAAQIACSQISAKEILMDRRKLDFSTIAYVGSDGSTHPVNVITWKWRD